MRRHITKLMVQIMNEARSILWKKSLVKNKVL